MNGMFLLVNSGSDVQLLLCTVIFVFQILCFAFKLHIEKKTKLLESKP